MFGDAAKKIESNQLLAYLQTLEKMEGYPKDSYPAASDFVRQAKNNATTNIKR